MRSITTVEELFDLHLQDIDERIAVGKLSHSTRRDYAKLPKLLRLSGMSRIPVSEVKPLHFSAVQREIEVGRTLRTQKNLIYAIKSVFNWGRDMELIERVNYGPRFSSPNSLAIENEQEGYSPERFIDRGLILYAIENARPALKVAILLGINCGFYPGDSIAVSFEHLHLIEEIPYHDFRRVKTKRRRMAVLWPETVDAINDYRKNHRPTARIDKNEHRLLLTRFGLPYMKTGEGGKLIESFGHLLEKAGSRVKGVSLGSLRHTYATIIDSVPDQTMIDLTMGHTNKSLQKRVYKQFNRNELSRLKVLSDTVHDWLYLSK